MKVVTGLLLVVAVVELCSAMSPKPAHSKFTPLSVAEQHCVWETKTDFRYIVDNINSPRTLFFNPKTRCYMTCVMRKNGSILKGGAFNKEKFWKKLRGATKRSIKDRDLAASAIENCAHQWGANECESSYKKMACFIADKNIQAIKEIKFAGFERLP